MKLLALQLDTIRPTLPRVIKYAERSMIRKSTFYVQGWFVCKDTISCLSIYYQSHTYTYNGPIKISEKQFLLLICIFLSVRNFKWLQCNCKNWNQWNYFLRKVSFLQYDNNEMNIDCFIHSNQSLKMFGHNLKIKFHFNYDSI